MKKPVQHVLSKVFKYIVGPILLVALNVLGEIGLLVCGALLFFKWDPSIAPKRRRRIKKKPAEDKLNCYVGEEGEESEWSFRTRYR